MTDISTMIAMKKGIRKESSHPDAGEWDLLKYRMDEVIDTYVKYMHTYESDDDWNEEESRAFSDLQDALADARKCADRYLDVLYKIMN